jgi:hypothetical protein
MAVAVMQEWSGGGADTTNYDAITAHMGVDRHPPEGMIVHTAGMTPDGGFRVFDVWESLEAFERFDRERLGPAIKAVLADAGGPPPGPPTGTTYELHNVLRP